MKTLRIQRAGIVYILSEREGDSVRDLASSTDPMHLRYILQGIKAGADMGKWFNLLNR
jgi:hypothetical protein